MIGRRIGGVLAVAMATVLLVPAGAALAQKKTTAEPTINTNAYYWKDASSEQVNTPVGQVDVTTPSPFCPGSVPGGFGSAEELCATDVLPVWIRQGDYDEPYMLSAASFDLTLVPVGSEVLKFTATFRESESGCEDHDDNPQTPPQCQETNPINIEGKRLQACIVGQIFGGGDSRPYGEVPDHNCSPTDPVAKRKEVKNDAKDDPDDQTPDHVWTFDLTEFAQQWVSEFTIVTGIMITAKTPKETDSQDNWRVVLAGPSAENGVKTKLVYIPGEGPEIPLPPGTETGGFTPGGTGGFTTTTGGTGGFGTGGTDFPTGGEAVGGEQPAEGADPVEAAELPAGAEAPPVEAFPAYMWLAILAGLIAFSMVRQVVLEKATGIRPHGALAQIRSLNAARRGAPIDAGAAPAAAGLGGLVRSGASRVSGAVSGVAGKFRSFTRKG